MTLLKKIRHLIFQDRKKVEFMRKSIHIMSISLPIMYRYIFLNDKKITILVLLGLIITSITIELFRLQNKNFRKYFLLFFGIMLRKHEINNLTGASYLLVSAIICVAFFPADIAFVAMAFLSIGDTFAALIGMNYGKRKFKNSPKSFEGTLACFITTFSFGVFFVDPVIAFWGAISASIIELVNIPVDDNVKIPIISGITMCGTYVIM